ncbi:WD40/YVTN/BNR-like repeat-containing protein [Aliikangiella sp. IMCC44653]
MQTIAFIATRKGLFRLFSDWSLSKVAFEGVPVTSFVINSADGVCYAGLNHGHFGVKMHRSADWGETWQEVSAPAYPKAEEPDKGESVELIWSLAFARPENSDELWLGTVPGGLFYSNNGGKSWTLNQSLFDYQQQHEWFGGGYDKPGIHSICVDPRNSQHIRVAISCGGVWQTLDAANSWSNVANGMRAEYMPPEQAFDLNIQDPHYMVQCKAHPDYFWVQHHNGIFKSSDSANHWQEIENVKPSNFGFAVAVHPNNPQQAWFVPGVKDECRVPVDAKLVVTRTKDGGETFESLSQGLPEQACYDLIYRHALDVDVTGERLLMGSTTGNLWISENEGDQWRCLSHYLPPIYAVHFVK